MKALEAIKHKNSYETEDDLFNHIKGQLGSNGEYTFPRFTNSDDLDTRNMIVKGVKDLLLKTNVIVIRSRPTLLSRSQNEKTIHIDESMLPPANSIFRVLQENAMIAASEPGQTPNSGASLLPGTSRHPSVAGLTQVANSSTTRAAHPNVANPDVTRPENANRDIPMITLDQSLSSSAPTQSAAGPAALYIDHSTWMPTDYIMPGALLAPPTTPHLEMSRPAHETPGFTAPPHTRPSVHADSVLLSGAFQAPPAPSLITPHIGKEPRITSGLSSPTGEADYYHASQSAIGLLKHFKRIPNNADAERWLREVGGLKHARDKAVRGRCRAALALLNPSDHSLTSMRSNPRYNHFPTLVLRQLEKIHNQNNN
jgi:hypothetical protein